MCVLVLLFCLDLLKNRHRKVCPREGVGRDQVCRPRSAHHHRQVSGAQDPRPGGRHSPRGCSALLVALAPVAGGRCPPGPVTGIRRTRSPAAARGHRLPWLPQGLGYDHDCGAGAAALRGGGTGNSDLSGPAAAAAAFCVRRATAGRGRLPSGSPSGSQRLHGSAAGHPKQRKDRQGKGHKTHSLEVYFCLLFGDLDYFCLKK